MDGTSRGDYAEVNGLNMYYEVHGTGRPLLLLHGAYMTIDAMGEVLSRLAESRQVIAVELQAHGRTADIDRPLGYESMADDVAALLRHLEVEEADVFGFGMGGGCRPAGGHQAPGAGAQAGGCLGLLHERQHAPRAAGDDPVHHAGSLRRLPDRDRLSSDRAEPGRFSHAGRHAEATRRGALRLAAGGRSGDRRAHPAHPSSGIPMPSASSTPSSCSGCSAA